VRIGVVEDTVAVVVAAADLEVEEAVAEVDTEAEDEMIVADAEDMIDATITVMIVEEEIGNSEIAL